MWSTSTQIWRDLRSTSREIPLLTLSLSDPPFLCHGTLVWFSWVFAQHFRSSCWLRWTVLYYHAGTLMILSSRPLYLRHQPSSYGPPNCQLKLAGVKVSRPSHVIAYIRPALPSLRSFQIFLLVMVLLGISSGWFKHKLYNRISTYYPQKLLLEPCVVRLLWVGQLICLLK